MRPSRHRSDPALIRLRLRAARSHAWAVALRRYRGDTTATVPRSDTSQALCLLWLSQGCTDWCETRRHLRHRTHDLVLAAFYPIHRRPQ